MTETALITRTPEIIATEIISIREQGKKFVLMASIEIGRRLCEAKELVSHGEWGTWCEKLDYSQRTASNLMRLYQEYGGSQMSLFGGTADSQAIANLTYTQAVALLGIPSHEREQFIEENDVENMSVRELQQAIKERDEAQRRLKEVEENADEMAEEKRVALEEAVKAKAALTNLEFTVKTLEKDLKEARKNSASPEMVKKLEADLAEAQRKVKELEEEAKKPVTLEPAIVEKVVEIVPADVERELEALRLFKEKAGLSEARLKFKVHFESVVADFKLLLGDLAEIRDSEPESYEKYRKAVSETITKMQQSL